LVRAEDPVAKVAQALIPQGNRLGGASACSAARSAEWLGAAAAGPAAAPVTMVAAPISAASARHPRTRAAMCVLGICPPAFLLRSGPRRRMSPGCGPRGVWQWPL